VQLFDNATGLGYCIFLLYARTKYYSITKVFNALITIPEDENVDCIVMQMPPDFFNLAPKNEKPTARISDSLKEQCAQAFLNMKRVGKPFVLWRTSMDRNEDDFVKRLESDYLPVFPSSERAIKVLSSLYKYQTIRMRETAEVFFESKRTHS